MPTRKDFLAAGAAAAFIPQAVAAATAPPTPLPSARPTQAPADDFPALAFDLAAFDALLARPAAHRHLFASIEVDGGEVFGAMRNTLGAYRDIGVAYTQVFPVAVLYHASAIALAFNDAVWNDLLIPAATAKKPGPLAAFAAPKDRGNPYLHPHAKSAKYDASFESLASDAGARIFVCNLATMGYARLLAPALRLKAADVYARLRDGLVPGAMLAPAGVWAVHAVQERRFTLLQTSLAAS